MTGRTGPELPSGWTARSSPQTGTRRGTGGLGRRRAPARALEPAPHPQVFSLIVFSSLLTDGYQNKTDSSQLQCILNSNHVACSFAVGAGLLSFLSSLAFLALDAHENRIASTRFKTAFQLLDFILAGEAPSPPPTASRLLLPGLLGSPGPRTPSFAVQLATWGPKLCPSLLRGHQHLRFPAQGVTAPPFRLGVRVTSSGPWANPRSLPPARASFSSSSCTQATASVSGRAARPSVGSKPSAPRGLSVRVRMSPTRAPLATRGP